MKTLAMVAASSAAAILASVAWLATAPVHASALLRGPEVAGLERRVAALEESPVFEVVDSQGRTILSVAPQNVSLYNQEQDRVFALTAANGSGAMTAWSADKAVQSSAGVFGAESGFFAFDKDRERVSVGRRDAGNYALRILSSTGATVVGIGESTEGAGMVVVNDGSGHQRASMLMSDGRPGFLLTNADGAGIAFLKESMTGAGQLELGDKTGEPMVKMVVNENRYGAVLAGPRAGFPLVPKSGLPGSYFLGCAGGDSCHP